MAFQRLKYGIECDASERDDSGGAAGWIVAVLLAAAAISLACAVARRMVYPGRDAQSGETAAETDGGGSGAPAAATARSGVNDGGAVSRPLTVMDMSRPKKVRNLLLRLNEAEHSGDIEMQVAAIWQLQELPGDAAADLVSSLAPRLGELNMAWLFERKNPKWVSHVEIKPGDTPSRIAAVHGSTLASMARLNGWGDTTPPIRAGAKLYVMERPRFSIVAHRKLGEVDLFLSGRLFKRYATKENAEGAKSGQYSTDAEAGKFLANKGFSLAREDAGEIDMLVPRGTPVNID